MVNKIGNMNVGFAEYVTVEGVQNIKLHSEDGKSTMNFPLTKVVKEPIIKKKKVITPVIRKHTKTIIVKNAKGKDTEETVEENIKEEIEETIEEITGYKPVTLDHELFAELKQTKIKIRPEKPTRFHTIWDGEKWVEDGAKKAKKESWAAISEIEQSITPRRLREAVLGTDKGWLAEQEAKIAALRAKLIKE